MGTTYICEICMKNCTDEDSAWREYPRGRRRVCNDCTDRIEKRKPHFRDGIAQRGMRT